MENKVYSTLSAVSVKDKVEKKGRFDYLSWAWAWHMLKTSYPDAQRIVYESTEHGMPYFNDGKFANVKVGIVVNGQEHIDYLPITDNSNRSVPYTKITSFDINNSIQRSTAKAIAMHGLGLSLWIGEDTSKNWATEPPKMTKEFTLDIGGDDWVKVMKYVANNKDLGMEQILNNLSTKYKITNEIKEELSKAISE
jgi:hypothetical protein